MNKEIKNRDGSVDTIYIGSNDQYSVNMDRKYKLVKYNRNSISDRFRNSILGMDIGINNSGFVSITIISLLLAILSLGIMYYSFRI